MHGKVKAGQAFQLDGELWRTLESRGGSTWLCQRISGAAWPIEQREVHADLVRSGQADDLAQELDRHVRVRLDGQFDGVARAIGYDIDKGRSRIQSSQDPVRAARELTAELRHQLEVTERFIAAREIEQSLRT
jgi:hypothetical protein